MQVHVVCQSDAASGFELWEAQLDCQFTSPHDFTATPSNSHELCLCSAQRNNFRKSSTTQKLE